MAPALPFLTAGMKALQNTASAVYPLLQAEATSMVKETQSILADQEARVVEQETGKRVESQAQQYRQALGARRNQLGALHIAEAGSPADVFSWSRFQENQALEDTRYQGALKATRFRNQALLTRMEGHNQKRLGEFQAGTKLLQGLQSWVP